MSLCLLFMSPLLAVKQWSWIQQAPCSSILIHHSTFNTVINPDRTWAQQRKAGRKGWSSTMNQWLPLCSQNHGGCHLCVCVFLNDSSAILDTEATEYPYIFFCLGTFDFVHVYTFPLMYTCCHSGMRVCLLWISFMYNFSASVIYVQWQPLVPMEDVVWHS